jgi:serine/threonine protein kinase
MLEVNQLSNQEGRLGEYEILHEVAQGACTIVYEARHALPQLGHRRVALQVLRRNRHRTWFLHTMRLNAALDHPCIPSLYEVAEVEGRLYGARSFVEGDDLQNGIGNGELSVAEVTRVIREVGGVLDYVHGRGLLHGYVHPRHVLLGRDGSVWLIGFGESPLAEAAGLDNPLHLAPEQLEHTGAANPAIDIFALSETTFWLLSGRHPFAGLRGNALRDSKRTGKLRRSLRELRPHIPVEVEQVLRRGLAPQAVDRYSSAGEFAAALVSAMSGKADSG